MAVNLGQAVGYLELDVSAFSSSLSNARNQLSTFSDQATGLSGRFSALGSALTGIGSSLTQKVTMPIAGIGTAAIAMGTDFNSAMSQLGATMLKPVDQIQELRETAIEMGNKTKFSAVEAAEGLNYLALAGYDSSQQMAALPKVLTLAQAGGMDLAAASDMLTDSMSALGLASTNSEILMANMDATVDQMAKTASNSNTSVAQLGEAILTVGGTAKSLAGFQVSAAEGTTELNTALGILADNGIKASEGGTALRNVITRLNPKTDAAKEAFDKLGISAFDMEGNMRPLKDVFGDMNVALSGYSQEQQDAIKYTIFGDSALAASTALLGTSAERWDELSGEIRNSSGAAQDMADIMGDNLQGDLDEFNSAIGTAAITINDMFEPAARAVAQALTQLVNSFNSADPATQKLIVGLAGIAAAVGPVLLVFGQISSAVGTSIAAFQGIGTAIAGAFGGGSLAGVAGFAAALAQVSVAVGVIIGLVSAFKSAWDQNLNGIQQNVQSIFSNIQTIMQGVLDVGVSVVNGIVSAWQNDFGGIRTFVETAITGIIAVIAGVLEVAVGVGSSIQSAWNSDFAGIRTMATTAFNTIGTVIKSVLTIATTVASAIGKALTQAFELGKKAVSTMKSAWDSDFAGIKTIVTGAVSAITKVLQTISDVASEVVTMVKAIFDGDWKTAFESAKDIVKILWEGIKDAFKIGIDAIKEALPKLKTAITEGFTKAKDKAVEIAKKIWDKVKEVFSNMVSGAAEKMSDFASKVADGATKAKDKAVSFFKELPGKLGEIIGLAIGKAVVFVTEFPAKASEAATNFITNASNFLQELPGKVWGFLTDVISKAATFVTDFGAKALDAGAKFLEHLSSGVQEAPSKMTEIAGKILDAIKELPGKMLSLGADIVNGLKDGITNAANAAVQAAKDFAGGIIKGFKSALDIHSPSGVAKREVGEQLAQGIIDGVTGKKENAKKSAEELSKAMVSSAKSGMSSYKEIYDLSAEQQAAYWKKIMANTKEGSQAHIQAQAEYAKALKKSTSEAIKAESDFIKQKTLEWELYENLNGENAQKEAAFWKEVLGNLTEGSENYLKALKKYNAAVKQQQKEQESAEKDYLSKRKSKWDAWTAEHGENAKKEASYWKETLSHLTEGSKSYLEAYKNYQNALNEINAEKLQKYSDALEQEMVYNDVSIAEQARYWDKVRKQFKEGTEERIEADKKYLEAEKNVQSERLTLWENLLENTSVYNDISLRKQMDYWDKVRQQFKQGTNERIEADKKYLEAKQNYEAELATLNEQHIQMYQNALDEEMEFNDISIAGQADYWDRVRQQFEEGTSERIEADKKYLEALRQIDSEKLSVYQETLANEQVYHEMSLADLAAYWDVVRHEFEEGTEARLEADQTYFDAKKNLDEQLTQLGEQYLADQKSINEQLAADLQSLEQAYEDAVTKRQEAIVGQFKLFDAYKDETKTTGKELMGNLQSQVKALDVWTTELSALENKKILPSGLIDEIRDMGVGATEQIKALNSLSEQELETYADLWQEKMNMAREQAQSELESMRVEMGEEQGRLIDEANEKLDELYKSYVDSMKEIGMDAGKAGKEAAQQVQKGLQEGLEAEQAATEERLASVEEAFQSSLDAIQSMVLELKDLSSNASDYADSVKDSVKEALNAAKSVGGSGIGSLINAAVSGSHASGLSYVPYNGYVAQLHKGERVLTEEENKAYSSGKGGATMINNFYGTKPLDEKETARQFKLAQKQIALNW